MFEVKAY